MISQDRTRDFSALTAAQQLETLNLVEALVERLAWRAAQAVRRAAPFRVLLDVDDFRVEGQLFALEARMDFNPSLQASLKTHLYARVRWRMKDFVRKALRAIRVEACVASFDNGSVSNQYVAFSERFRATEYSDGLPDPRAKTPEELMADEEAKSWVSKALAARLTPREAIILTQRLAGEDSTDAELAATFGVDRSQVCRATASAVGKLAKAARPRGVASCG